MNLENICDSPTYHAASILLRARSSNETPTPDNGLSNFVDAITSIWNSSSSMGLNKLSQLAPSMHSHGVNITSDMTFSSSVGISSTASPILASQPQRSAGLMPSAGTMADHRSSFGVGGNPTHAGKPISKQVSMPASFDHKASNKRAKTLQSAPSYYSDQQLLAQGIVEGEARFSFSSGLEGRPIFRQKSI